MNQELNLGISLPQMQSELSIDYKYFQRNSLHMQASSVGHWNCRLWPISGLWNKFTGSQLTLQRHEIE